MSQPAWCGAVAPLPVSESSPDALEYSFKLTDVVGALQLRWSLISR